MQLDQSGNLDVNSLSINSNKIAYDNTTEVYHDSNKCVKQNSMNDVTLRANHMSTHKMCSNQIITSNISAGSVNSGEYNVNGKVIIDKHRNLFGKTITLGTDLILSNNNGNLVMNNTELFPQYIPPTTKQINESQFCQKWSIPYVGNGLVTGYVVSTANDGQYQTIIDSAGNISTSSNYGSTFKSTSLTNGSSLGSIAMSSDGQYQLTADYVGNLYQSSDYGNTWKSKIVFTLAYITFLDYISVSISQSGKYQVLCVEGKSYISNNFGLSFKQMERIGSNEVFKQVIAKEANYFDFTYQDSSGNIIQVVDQSAMFIALTYDINNTTIVNSNIKITSIDVSGNWLNDKEKYWVHAGSIDCISNAIAVSNDLQYCSVIDTSGNIRRSDTSGGLVNNEFYANAGGLYQWTTDIIENFNSESLTNISIDSSGTHQTIITNTGKIFSSQNTILDTSSTFVETQLPINMQSLLFINISDNGQFQYAMDETGRIHKSEDSGLTWLGTHEAFFTGIACSESGQYATIIDSSGYVIVTSSYGAIWGAPQKITSNDQSLLKITMSSNGKYQYAISEYNLYKSLDYGSTWTNVETIEADDSIANFSTESNAPFVVFAPLINVAISGDGSILVLIDSSYGQNGGTKNNSDDLFAYICRNATTTNVLSFDNELVIPPYPIELGPRVSSIALSETGEYIAISDVNQNIMFSNTYGKSWLIYDKLNDASSNMTEIAMTKSGNFMCLLSQAPTAIISNFFTQLFQAHGILDKTTIDNNKQGSSLAISNDATYKIVAVSDESTGSVYVSHKHPSESIIPTWNLTLNTTNEIKGTAMSGDGKYVFVVDKHSIYLSDSYGQNFNSTETTTKYDIYNKKSFLSLAMSSDGKIQSALDYSGNVYVSVDTGTTWNDPVKLFDLLDDTNVNIPAKIKMSANGEFQYVITYQNESKGYLLRSLDFGKNWQVVYTTNSTSFFSLATSATGQHIAIGSVLGIIFISHDFGDTFSEVSLSENLEYKPIIDISMSASGEYQSLVTVLTSENESIIYVSKNYGSNWKPILNEISGYTIGASIAVSDTGQHQSYIGCDFIFTQSYIATSSDFGESFDKINLLPYFEDTSGQHIFNLPTSIAISGTGKYQAMLAITSNSALIFLYKSTDFGNTWNISETLPIVSLGRNSFGNQDTNYFPNFILLLIFSRFAISADGQYTAIALNDSIYLSNSAESFDNAVAKTLEVTTNAQINNLNVSSLTVNGGYIAKTKIVQHEYNVELSDYIVCCDTSGCIVKLPSFGIIGQTLMFTNGRTLLSYLIYPPTNGKFDGVTIPTEYGQVGMDNVILLCLGSDNWITISRYGNIG